MANRYYIPQGQSLGERVADPLLKLMQIKQQGALGEEHNRLAGQDIELRGRALEEAKIKRETETPLSRKNYSPQDHAMLTQMLESKGLAKPLKFLLDDMGRMAENPNVDAGTIHGHFKSPMNWQIVQPKIVEALDNAAMESEQGGQTFMRDTYKKLSDQIGNDKTGAIVDWIFPQVAREKALQEAEVASKFPAPQGYKPSTREEMLADAEAKAQIEARNRPPREPDKTPNDMREFELFTYGKEVPEMRGTPQYKDSMLGYMKSKRDATVAPSKADPAVLRKEFIGQSKDFVQVRDSYNRIKASSTNPSPAGDLAMIFNYMKMLDPGSVVRESEFATAAASGSYGERIKAAVNKAMNGERLSDEMRKDFTDRSKMLYDKQLETHNKLKEEYDRISKGLGVESSNVLIDYLSEQKKIENQEYDVGSVYEDANGNKKKYLGNGKWGEP